MLRRRSGGSDDFGRGDVEPLGGRVELRLDLEVRFVGFGQDGVVEFGAGGRERLEGGVDFLLTRKTVDDVVQRVGNRLRHDGYKIVYMKMEIDLKRTALRSTRATDR